MQIRAWMIFVFIFATTRCAGGANTTSNNNNQNNNTNNTNNLNNNQSDFGKTCNVIQDCHSGVCIPFSSPNDTRCTITCTAGSCPSGFSCRPANRDVGAPNVCLPLSTLTCTACEHDNDCGFFSDRCIPTGGIKGCLMDCSVSASECEGGQVCTPAISTDNVSTNVCKPAAGSCDCSPANEGIVIPCTNENAYGSCSGYKTCRGATGWSTCDAPTPAAEVCDGQDNNCNGQSDEGLLGTVENCSGCGNTCPGQNIAGSHAECINNQCRLYCDTDYYNADQQEFNGCECRDDTESGTSVAEALYLGSFEDCDFTHNAGDYRVPVDANTIAHSDYFKYEYRNTWSPACWAYNYVRINVPSGSTPMQLCGGGASNETGWSCVTASPGGYAELEMQPLPGNGNSTTFYFRVRTITNQAAPGCGDYNLVLYDTGDL